MTYNDKDFVFKDNIKEIIAKNIRKYRIEKGYTQEQLAVYTDRSFEFIRRIETDYGKRGFSVETLYRISVVLEKDMTSFFVYILMTFLFFLTSSMVISDYIVI